MKKINERVKKEQAITLIALVITIVVLIILAAVAINMTLGNNGIFNKAQVAKNDTERQTATELINLKITTCQMQSYVEKGQSSTLAYLAAYLQNDKDTNGDIEYVEMQSKKQASLDESPYISWDKIYTKLSQYPFEFEINSSLQLASVDGIKVETNTSSGKTFTIFLDGNEVDYFPEITTNVKLISATASNGATIVYNESNSSFQISNLSNLNTTFQLNYMTVNDYRRLIALAGIQSNFNSMDELMNDKTALEKVFDSDEATLYLIKSSELLNAIKNSKTAMQSIGSSEKLMYKTIINDSIRPVILASSYVSVIDNAAVKVPVLTNNNENKILYSSCMPSYGTVWGAFDNSTSTIYRVVHGEAFSNTYIGYNFGQNLICYKTGITIDNFGYSARTRNAVIQTSSNGTSWTNITNQFSITSTANTPQYFTSTNLTTGSYFRFKGISGDTLESYGNYAHTIPFVQFYCVKVPTQS